MLKHIVTVALSLALCTFAGCGHKGEHSDHGHEVHEHHHHDHEGSDGHEGHHHSSDEHDADEHDHAHGHDHDHDHAHAGGEIIVKPEVAERFGLATDTIQPSDFAVTVRTWGTVTSAGTADAVVAAPTAGIVRFASGVNAGREVGRGAVVATIDATGISGGDANKAAKAALEAARTEYERIQALYTEQLATVGERNAALAALRAAEAAYSPAASSGRATSPIAGTITSLEVKEGQFVNPGDVIATVADASGLTLRVDLPQNMLALAPSFTDLVADFSYLPQPVSVSELGGRRIGSGTMPAQGSASAYAPIYFSVPGGKGIVSGSTFTAYLIGQPRQGVITVPVEALSEQQGRFFVYERLDEEGFAKLPVTTGASDGRRIEITSGVKPGDVIVVSGVSTVRLSEAGANIPEGHTHNH